MLQAIWLQLLVNHASNRSCLHTYAHATACACSACRHLMRMRALVHAASSAAGGIREGNVAQAPLAPHLIHIVVVSPCHAHSAARLRREGAVAQCWGS